MNSRLSNFSARHPYLALVAKNTFTLFNLVNVILALMVALVGSHKNMLFIVIALANTLISIVNGIRAQRTVDKLKLLAEEPPKIKRGGEVISVAPEEVKPGDILFLSLGDQILFDSKLTSGEIEVNEALLTGEQENIPKKPGDELISGSFVVSGSAEAEVTHALADNFATKLAAEAKTVKTADSKLFHLMNSIVKYISYALIPVGALLLWARFRTEPDTTTAVTSTVAALINMIPEGLILLTSSVLALATIRLSRKKILVQDLYAIETLARVDTVCLDKTGTLTSGRLAVRDFLLPNGQAVDVKKASSPAEKRFLRALEAVVASQTAENATISALKKELALGPKFEATEGFAKIDEIIPFSSDRKYSGFRSGETEYLLGAIDFLASDKELIKSVKALSKGHRTLALIEKQQDPPLRTQGRSRPSLRGSRPFCLGRNLRQIPQREFPAASCRLLGLIRLEDELRPTAPKIVRYFYNNDIDIKIISGDDLIAVTKIAEKTGVKDLRGVELSELKTKNYADLVKNYAIFTRVTPSEKKELIKALREQSKTVAMTGDGVNDILAMKEADVSLAIAEGSDAARRAAKFVLLGSSFEAVPAIIDEGRQSINNLERSTSLFLAKTVYASVLAVLFVFLPLSYPFTPIEMSLLNFACIGFPGLILALEKNTSRPKNLFLKNIITYSTPVGLTVVVACLALSIASEFLNFSRPELTTISCIVVFTLDLILIYWISRPLNKLRAGLLAVIIAIVLGALLIPLAHNFFEFAHLSLPGIITTLSVTAGAVLLFFLFRHLAKKLSPKLLQKFNF